MRGGMRKDISLRARLGERGAVAVEFALVLPVLVMLMFGIITSGLAYADHLSITNAVREGGRFGAAIDYSSDSKAWADSVQSRVQQVYLNGAGTLSSSQVCVELIDSAGNPEAEPTNQGSCGTAPTPPAMSPGSCAVMVWVEKPARISILVAADMDFNIKAKSVSYYGRTAGSCTAT